METKQEYKYSFHKNNFSKQDINKADLWKRSKKKLFS
jgi:hypothetical protein